MSNKVLLSPLTFVRLVKTGLSILLLFLVFSYVALAVYL